MSCWVPHIYFSDFWFKSLSRLTRVLQCGRDLSDPFPSTTGLPEGDSMSVVGMLALSFVFHAKLGSPRVHPYAYADNWSFMSTSERHSFQAMQALLNLVSDLRMKIDFNKSWCWATTKTFRMFWTQASALLVRPDFVFTIKSHVHDLGCNISYTHAVVLGPLRDKIDNAVAKCNRLRRLHLSLEERAEKLQSAIWPAVFYGALGQTIGCKHFTTLRRAATSVLVGDHKHASSIIAMQFLTHKVQDPLLYIVSDMLCTLRRLFVYYPDLAAQIVTTVRELLGTSQGPGKRPCIIYEDSRLGNDPPCHGFRTWWPTPQPACGLHETNQTAVLTGIGNAIMKPFIAKGFPIVPSTRIPPIA